MSVLVTVTIPCDTDAFLAVAAERAEEMTAISHEGRDQGAIHHRFAIGDGAVVVFDEWDSAESFQGFFADNAAIADLMQAAGASGPPEVAIYEAIESADAF
jgi:hypothetical protein